MLAVLAARQGVEGLPPQNPRDSAARIEQGLQAEREGRFAEAEMLLLEGAKWDRQYLPAWTLANYYFRRERSPEFWLWAARAAEMSYGDLRPLLRLCDASEQEPATLLSRFGKSPRLERTYLDLMIGEQRWTSAEYIARRIQKENDEENDPADAARLADLVDREIRANRAEAARSLANPRANFDLQHKPRGVGFDWTLPACPGIETTWFPGVLEFEFSGSQGDTCTLAEYPIAQSRRTRWQLRAPSIEGVTWMLDEAPIVPGTRFVTVPRDGIVWLRIVQRRAPGTIPRRGRVEISNIRFDLL